jgi:hypothetical protein
VEAALVTPLLLALVFGMLELGLVFKDLLAVNSAVRAGVRMASAEPRQATFAQDAANQVAKAATALDMSGFQALWVYKANPDGTPVGGDSTFTTCGSCVRFTWNGTAFSQWSSTWAAMSQNACAGDPSHDTIGIYLSMRHPAVTGFFFQALNLDDHAVMSLEPIPVSSVCK